MWGIPLVVLVAYLYVTMHGGQSPSLASQQTLRQPLLERWRPCAAQSIRQGDIRSKPDFFHQKYYKQL